MSQYKKEVEMKTHLAFLKFLIPNRGLDEVQYIEAGRKSGSRKHYGFSFKSCGIRNLISGWKGDTNRQHEIAKHHYEEKHGIQIVSKVFFSTL